MIVEMQGTTRRRSKIDVAMVVPCCLVMASALASGPGGPLTRGLVLRFKGAVGLADLKRAYTYQTGTIRPVFEHDPARLIEWVDVNYTGGFTLGCGPNDSGSSEYSGGGIIGFADGSVEGYSGVCLSSDSREPMIVLVR
jgi:prepilin-type processing-associated H-X9-DG protein